MPDSDAIRQMDDELDALLGGPPEDDEPLPWGAVSSAPVTFCHLLADNSGSMGGRPIEELCGSLHKFACDIKNHPLLPLRLENQLDFFNDRRQVACRMGPATAFTPPEVIPTGAGTAMGAALNGALDDLRASIGHAQAQGRTIQHVVLLLLTDGHPTDGPEDFARAARRIAEWEREGGFTFYAFGVGPNADLNRLGTLVPPPRKARRLESVADFTALFGWLFRSLVSVSQARVD